MRRSRGRRMEKKKMPANSTQPIIRSHASIAPPKSEIPCADAASLVEGGQVPAVRPLPYDASQGLGRIYLIERLSRTVVVAGPACADPRAAARCQSVH